MMHYEIHKRMGTPKGTETEVVFTGVGRFLPFPTFASIGTCDSGFEKPFEFPTAGSAKNAIYKHELTRCKIVKVTASVPA